MSCRTDLFIRDQMMLPLKDDNPVHITPIFTWLLISVNTIVFIYQVSMEPDSLRLFIYRFGSIPAVVMGHQMLPENIAAVPPHLSILTSMFMHGGWMHLIGNMWFLWIFGNNIEEAMGRLRFLVFYLLCGVAASWSHILFNVDSVIPTIGASGAIGGVMGAYILIYPRARVWTLIFLGFFIRVLYMPAVIILGYWFVIQVMSGFLSGARSGVAFWAHVGGFIAGVLLTGLFKKRQVRFFNPPYRR
jgi:membrane associated rhomboid family serine protease